MKAIIQIATPSLERSLDFYERSNFKYFKQDDKTYIHCKPFIALLNDDPYARSGIRIYDEKWERLLIDKKLEKNTTKTSEGYIIKSPEGCPMYLDTSPTYLINTPENHEHAIFGNYAGFSLESTNLNYSIDFWGIFGFEVSNGDPTQGWVELKDVNGFALSLLGYQACPHLFPIPSISYFNGGNSLAAIEKIKTQKLTILEEITRFNKEGIADNIIVMDPSGFGFFVFND